MDTRKIQFLIGIQREIDKLEAKDGNTPKIEKVKSRFYDVIEVEEVVNTSGLAKQDADIKTTISMSEAEADTKFQRRKYTLEEVKENQGRIIRLLKESGSPKLNEVNADAGETDTVISPSGITQRESTRLIVRKNREEVKNDINFLDEDVSEGKDILTSDPKLPTRKNSSGRKKDLSTIRINLEGDHGKTDLHKPKDVAAFLVRFRERKNRGLKYLTHRWSDMKRDQPLTYEEVVENAKKEFQECVSLYTIPEMLRSKVREYVSTKSWSGRNRNGYAAKGPRFFYSVVNNGEVERVIVDSGWSSDEMIDWARNNPNSDPNQDDYWKKELIQPFKQAIEVRDGMFENYMKMNAEAILKVDYQRFNPVYGSSLKEARFFTDVPTLFEGIRRLLAVAKDSAKDPSLRFEYNIPDSTDMYGIRQIKIVTDKNPDIGSSSITKNHLIKGGDFGMAYDSFYGLCNWSILCKRGIEFVKINLLTDVDNVLEIELIDKTEVDGFTHILTFYDL